MALPLANPTAPGRPRWISPSTLRAAPRPPVRVIHLGKRPVAEFPLPGGLNARRLRLDQTCMIWFVLWAVCAYAAYRAIKGGFERPQSERLNGYGIFGLVVVAALILAWLHERLP